MNLKTNREIDKLLIPTGGLGIDIGGIDLPNVNLGGDAALAVDVGSIDLPGIDLGGAVKHF